MAWCLGETQDSKQKGPRRETLEICNLTTVLTTVPTSPKKAFSYPTKSSFTTLRHTASKATLSLQSRNVFCQVGAGLFRCWPQPLSAPLFTSKGTLCLPCRRSAAAAVAALGLAGAGTCTVLAGARVARCLHKQLHHICDVKKPSAAATAAADAQAAAEQLSIEKLACHRNVPPPHAPVVLVSCGSFNPPTVMHLRMFDLATAALAEVGGAVQALIRQLTKKPPDKNARARAYNMLLLLPSC